MNKQYSGNTPQQQLESGRLFRCCCFSGRCFLVYRYFSLLTLSCLFLFFSNSFSRAASVEDEDAKFCKSGDSMSMYSRSLDEALQHVQDDPLLSEKILAAENTPLALTYRAYLRECGEVPVTGPEDSAEALLDKAQKQLPPKLYEEARKNTEWSEASPTMNRILNTLFVLHSHYLK